LRNKQRINIDVKTSPFYFLISEAKVVDIALIFLDQMGSLILNPQIPADLRLHRQNFIEAAFPHR